ncbi:MAG: sulfate ABC transporter substrate-binding protein [Drouetiella hepatica Uher 2000/2452]|jgi:sulfate transport system substrate-binding protein|uniref:Sulfate ABC transporter substrate-binding protein n=1 Tax=Drouetiella hepatica Uher 2000/2452 TaxID=904376 RepID=A0A951Q726_9CYAN|nr:sulfate ABC transporter substrate-binding protein [Drouetiella hepatica Uher 2000/2452]
MGRFRFRSLKGFLSLFLVGLGLCLTLAACNTSPSETAASPAAGGSPAAQKETANLTLVSYAVTQAAYEQIIPKFTEKWKAEHNQEVVFDQSYGGSGSQTRAVIDGLEADVVALALALDTKKIEKAGLIEAGWEKEAPNGAIVHKSVAALVTREGNPKGIKAWADLTKGAQVITANPKTSGGARWNFLALWGAITQTGGNDAKALEYTTQVMKNVPVLPKDAREATDVFFKQGQGDVLINYENEVLLAKQRGENLPFVIPTDVNISIDNPVAMVDKNVDKHGTREIAQAFVEYLFTPEAQEEFAKVGFRPVDPSIGEKYANQYPKIDKLFTVQELGGWDAVQKKFFDDGAIFDQMQSKA